MAGANLLKKLGKRSGIADSSDASQTKSLEVLRQSKKGLLRNQNSPSNNASKVSLGPYKINTSNKHDPKDFIKRNILNTSDMQALLERFIVNKYETQLFSNQNIDQLSKRLGWDRETVLAYFTKVLAQKRYTLMQMIAEKKAINDTMEELRNDPESYLQQIEFDISKEEKPDVSILQDNQIVDLLVDKAAQDIEKLCDDENQRHDLIKITEGFKILTDETVNEHG